MEFRCALAGFENRVAHVVEINRNRERFVWKHNHFFLLLKVTPQLLPVRVGSDNLATPIVARSPLHDIL